MIVNPEETSVAKPNEGGEKWRGRQKSKIIFNVPSTDLVMR